jgi:hypothetical protein
MNTLFETALQQNWTIGEFKKRIQEQSSLKVTTLDRQLRGDESAGLLNIPNKHNGLYQFAIIDADSLDLNKLIREVNTND